MLHHVNCLSFSLYISFSLTLVHLPSSKMTLAVVTDMFGVTAPLCVYFCACVLFNLALGSAHGIHGAAQRVPVSLQRGPLSLQGGDDRRLHPVQLCLAPQAAQLLLHNQTLGLKSLREQG